jgi:hypothetical protein
MYASFLNLPAAGGNSRALHLELFTVPSALATFYELANRGVVVVRGAPAGGPRPVLFVPAAQAVQGCNE